MPSHEQDGRIYMKAGMVLLVSCAAALALLVRAAADEGHDPSGAETSEQAEPKPATKPAFVPVHVQIGSDGQERSVQATVPPPASPAGGGGSAAPAALARPDNLLGTWWDLRPALQHDGINPSVSYEIDMAGNPVGGLRQGFTTADNLALGCAFDLQRLCGLPGAKADISASLRSGTGLSDVYINNLFEVQQDFGGSTFRFVNLAIEQSAWEDRLNLRLGRFPAGDEFLASPLYTLFMQNGINGNPAGILFDSPGFTAYPIASWAARLRYKPVEEVYVMTGLYDGNPNVAANEMYGLDFSLRGPLFWITEVGYRLNSRKGATGLPGNYKAGVWYNDGSFEQFNPSVLSPGDLELARRLRLEGLIERIAHPRSTWGDFGFYVLMDQVVWRRGVAERQQSVTLFAGLLVAPENRINQMPYFIDGGLVCRGPIPARPRDSAGFQIGCGTISPVLSSAQQSEQILNPGAAVQRYEMMLEWVYSIHVTRGLQVEPDIQYIINPGAAGQYSNALVLGMQVVVNF
jgi:porin